jgi:hypothetical protein
MFYEVLATLWNGARDFPPITCSLLARYAEAAEHTEISA